MKASIFTGSALVLAPTATTACALLEPDVSNEGRKPGILLPTKSLAAVVNLPEKYDEAGSYSLPVVLHGNGGTAESFARLFGQYSTEPFIIAAPQGTHPKPSGGFSWFYKTTDRRLWELYDNLDVARLIEAEEEVSFPLQRIRGRRR